MEERSENERYYDEKIAPHLLRLAERCAERGMSFVAQVEYGPDETATTANAPANTSHSGKLTYLAARSVGNIDKLAMNLGQHVRQTGCGHNSIVLNAIGIPSAPEVKP